MFSLFFSNVRLVSKPFHNYSARIDGLKKQTSPSSVWTCRWSSTIYQISHLLLSIFPSFLLILPIIHHCLVYLRPWWDIVICFISLVLYLKQKLHFTVIPFSSLRRTWHDKYKNQARPLRHFTMSLCHNSSKKKYVPHYLLSLSIIWFSFSLLMFQTTFSKWHWSSIWCFEFTVLL